MPTPVYVLSRIIGKEEHPIGVYSGAGRAVTELRKEGDHIRCLDADPKKSLLDHGTLYAGIEGQRAAVASVKRFDLNDGLTIQAERAQRIAIEKLERLNSDRHRADIVEAVENAWQPGMKTASDVIDAIGETQAT